MTDTTQKTTENSYRMLGLEPGASAEEVKRAYRRLAKRWHPDHYQQSPVLDRDLAEEKFKEIKGAYEKISSLWVAGNGSVLKEKKENVSKAEKKAPSKAPKQPFQAGPKRADPVFSFFKKGLERTGDFFSNPSLVREHRAVSVFFILFVVISVGSSFFTLESKEKKPIQSFSKAPSASQRFFFPDNPFPSAERKTTLPEDRMSSGSPQLSNQTKPSLSFSSNRHDHAESIPKVFGLNSTKEEVFSVQGPPTEVRGQAWLYNLSEVHFKDGRVANYDNFDGSLRVQNNTDSDPKPLPSTFTLGSTQDEVLRIQGAPSRVEGNQWHYGLSKIRFAQGRVVGYDNFFQDLKVSLTPSNETQEIPSKDYFTLGSNQDKVLAVHGTPTSIRGQLWSYELSGILFEDGKVKRVNNPHGVLHFVPTRSPAGEAHENSFEITDRYGDTE